MVSQTIAKRVERLEMNVQGFADLPDRMASLEGRMASVETQIVQFREEVRTEFSAVRMCRRVSSFIARSSCTRTWSRGSRCLTRA